MLPGARQARAHWDGLSADGNGQRGHDADEARVKRRARSGTRDFAATSLVAVVLLVTGAPAPTRRPNPMTSIAAFFLPSCFDWAR